MDNLDRDLEVPLPTTKAQQTKARILNSALDLFREKGFDETTMRDIAASAGVATGATYYYFGSKDDLAMAFYGRLAEESREVIPPALARTRDFKNRVHFIIEQKLEQFENHRRFIGALFRTAVGPESTISPFGEETKPIRDEAIGWFQMAIDGSNVTVPKEFRESLPRLLWLYQMGIVMFWIYDRSPGQERTHRFVNNTIDLIVQGLKLSGLPLLGSVRRRVATIVKDLNMASDYDDMPAAPGGKD